MTNGGDAFPVDIPLEKAKAAEYDALILPGGVINPDKLRINSQAIEFIKAFFQNDKLIAAICHGPWPLINAEAVKGYKMTSWPSIQLDLINAGATWVDQECVIDRNRITSRKPEDIPAFSKAIIEFLSKQ